MEFADNGRRSRMKEASNSKLLAVWWLDGNRFFGPVETLDGANVERYGDYLTLGLDHFQVWDSLVRGTEYEGMEYDELPRGRVNFKANIRKFVVVGPSDLVGEPSFQSAVRSEYGLPATTLFESDEHYGR